MEKNIGYTAGEMISVCIARSVQPDDVLGQGIGSPLVAVGYLLAKRMHAPEVTISSTIGNSLSVTSFPLSLSYMEKYTIGNAIHLWDFPEATSVLVSFRKITIEFFRPAQMDAFGNSNNIAIGDYQAPKVRLPGCGGIADATTVWPRIEFYIPRHSKQVMKEKLDFRSGIGGSETQAGPWLVITDLCILRFDQSVNRMVVESLHPGVTLEQVQQNTEFELTVPVSLAETAPPTEEELYLIRNKIDPLGISRLETVTGPMREKIIEEIVDKERNMYFQGLI